MSCSWSERTRQARIFRERYKRESGPAHLLALTMIRDQWCMASVVLVGSHGQVGSDDDTI